MSERIRPGNTGETREAVAWALANERPIELIGAGSKRALGRPLNAEATLDLSRLAGIGIYEPEELVMGAGPGTTVAEIETTLAERRQMLAFEPMDLGPLLGAAAGAGSIGGVFACNLAGPRRIKAGAARDHLLGFSAVSGRAEVFKSGGRVVKNVTGYDLSKLVAGSHGTLAALTDLTFKVMPAPEKTRSVLVFGLDAERARAAMSAALGSPHEVSGAAHLPAAAAARSAVGYVARAGAAVTALRVEGPGPSVEHRCAALREQLGAYGAVEELHSMNSATLWREIRDVAAFLPIANRAIWRVSVAPTAGPAVAAALPEAEVLFDWGGGLAWLSAPAANDGGAAVLRAAVAASGGGHATLIAGPGELRARISVFEPQPTELAALTRRVKDAFDPRRILNPGRMYAGV